MWKLRWQSLWDNNKDKKDNYNKDNTNKDNDKEDNNNEDKDSEEKDNEDNNNNVDNDNEDNDKNGVYHVKRTWVCSDMFSEWSLSRGGRCSVFLTMQCFSDAMFSNS